MYKEKLYSLLMVIVAGGSLRCQPTLIPIQNTFDQLMSSKLYKKGNPLRLHLGCGQTYFNGYINIDFPPVDHTVQNTSPADVYGDITKLVFSRNSIDEIRSHHVFEHFERPIALALLCQWQQWLKIGGMLVIETPDALGCMKAMSDQELSFTQKQLVMRHLFGSHEARWAVHCDGWYKEKYEYILQQLGFGQLKIVRQAYKKELPNITVHAQKVQEYSLDEVLNRAKYILRQSMNGEGGSEEQLYQVWMGSFNKYLKHRIV
ncbi:MAG TPA: methyltransferase domain-containing protein [Candidatus Babeliales bacterium]|nr:methyltransferase domain-containing protein [Candidatus Babeliales bacterium]